MDIVSLCPFVASKLVWHAHTGACALTVVIKGTFELKPGTSTLADQQEPIHDRDVFWDDDPQKSVRAASDLVPYKPRPEVMLIGHAYAPDKQPVRNLMTRFVVSDLDKSIEVWCDRKFRVIDGQLLEGQRFTRMQLCWERAAGGPESTNPVGKRFDGPADAYGTISIANLQPAGTFVSKRSDTFVPMCYAPMAASWPGRTRRLGRLSRKFFQGGWEDEPLPSDFDSTFFQTAPLDQQVTQIRPDERIVLENLHRDHARLVTSLPGLSPRAVADRATGEREEISLVADTLWIDTDRSLCCVVWRGSIGLRHAGEAGRIAVWVDALPMLASSNTAQDSIHVGSNEPDVATTMFGVLLPSLETALPFVGGESRLAQQKPSFGASIPSTEGGTNDDGTGTMFVKLDKLVGQTLPFAHQRSAAPDFEQTLSPSALPSAAIPFVPAMAIPAAPARIESVLPYADLRIPEPGPIFSGPPEPPKIDVAPPAMIGPVATAEVEQDKPVEEEPEDADEDDDVVVEEPAETDEEDDGGEVIALSIEQTATIAAELAEGHKDRPHVLEAHALSERAWRKNETRWEAAIEAERERGKNTLRGEYDAAYVKRVEGFRGAITVREYAEIMVATERGTESVVLKELRIQQAALMPIVRVWAKKMAGDRSVGKEAMSLLREVRGR